MFLEIEPNRSAIDEINFADFGAKMEAALYRCVYFANMDVAVSQESASMVVTRGILRSQFLECGPRTIHGPGSLPSFPHPGKINPSASHRRAVIRYKSRRTPDATEFQVSALTEFAYLLESSQSESPSG